MTRRCGHSPNRVAGRPASRRPRERAAGEIAAAFDVTRTAVSRHLTVLKNAGLISERRDGTRRLYRGRPEGRDDLR
nr:metalloregulator ArsR/SmtB family transcription factor [Streptomyces sp. A012304]